MRRMGTARATYVCIEMSHYPVNLVLVVNEDEVQRMWEGAIGSRIWGRSVPAYDYCRCRTRHLDPFLFTHCCPLEQGDLENHGE